MNEICDDCGGLLGVGGPHVCDPNEVSLGLSMKAEELIREAKELENASFFLSTQYFAVSDSVFSKGYECAIANLRQKASNLRQKAAQLLADASKVPGQYDV